MEGSRDKIIDDIIQNVFSDNFESLFKNFGTKNLLDSLDEHFESLNFKIDQNNYPLLNDVASKLNKREKIDLIIEEYKGNIKKINNFVNLETFKKLNDLVLSYRESFFSKSKTNILKEYVDQTVYIGEVKDNLREGLGLCYDEEYLFIGSWEKDIQKTGICLKKTKNHNEIFIGNFESTEGKLLNFEGTYLLIKETNEENEVKNISFAQGKFVNHSENIEGVLVYSNQDQSKFDLYLGKTKDFKKNDTSAHLIKFEDNSYTVYIGGFEDDKFINRGKYINNDSSFWFDHDNTGSNISLFRINGGYYFGKIKLVDKSIELTGEESTIFYESNDVYLGKVISGKKEGKGIYIKRNKGNEIEYKIEGEFEGDLIKTGILMKYCSENNKFNVQFEGGFKDGIMSKGKYFHDNNESYEGEFKNQKRNGNGKFIYSDLSVFEGDWHENQKHGKGIYTDSKGNRFEGVWESDKIKEIKICQETQESS